MEDHTHLHLRLKHCLQTILDLREDLDSMPFGGAFAREIVTLEELLAKLADVSLNEYEVQRVELAAAKFLEELNQLLPQAGAPAGGQGGRLQ